MTSSKPTSKSSKNHKKRRTKHAEREVRAQQRSSELLLHGGGFKNVVKGIVKKHDLDVKFRVSALLALREAVEGYTVGLYEDTNKMAIHAGRITVQDKDVRVARRLRQEDNV